METGLFGTDGIRGQANHGIFVPEATLRLGKAIGTVVAKNRLKRKVLIGHDGRRSGGMIDGALCAGLLSAGVDVIGVDLITTPGLALLTKKLGAGLGIMISASHNPASDNGIKLFNNKGEKLAQALEKKIEQILEKKIFTQGKKLGQKSILHDAEKLYLEHLLQAVAKLNLRGLAIAVDCANGGSAKLAPLLFKKLGATVHVMANQPSGDNINRNCGALLPKKMANFTKKNKAQLGIALDGDGDRAIFADEKGRLLDGDAILAVAGTDLWQTGRLAKKTVVVTVMSNLGLHLLFAQAGIKTRTVAVGDKNVSAMLRKRGYSLGGEQSGHIIFGRDNFLIGDGLYTAIRILEIMLRRKQPISKLAAGFRRLPQVLRNVKVSSQPPIEKVPRLMHAVAHVETTLGKQGRVFLRYSGTEPLLRIMVEGPDLKTITKMADDLALVVRRELP